MSTKMLTRPAETGRPVLPSRPVPAGRPMGARTPLSMPEKIEGLISTVVRKLMPPPGAGNAAAPHSREVYRADAIALLIVACQHMGAATDEDQAILDLLLDAQRACAS
jgi:hypothetical protein